MHRKIKLLHILWSGEIGGTEEYILSLIRHSDYSRYQIYICFLASKGIIYEEAGKLNNINVTYIGIKNSFDIKGALKFALFLLKGRFDVIHSHMRNFLSTAIVTFFAYNVPKVLTHHIGPVDMKIFKKNKIFYKFFAGSFKEVIAISNMVKANLIQDFCVRPEAKVKVVHNCIDLKKFSESSGIPPDIQSIKQPDRFIIGFVGRMEYYKRPRLFIEVAYELLKKNRKYYFVMVGDGPELEKCRNMIHYYKINGNFKLLGFRRDIPNIMKLFDALLFTSFGEGFGLVLIEAMAVGVPVFAINDGAVPEIITHKENGILLETEDPEPAAGQISEFIEDEQLMSKVKKQAVIDVHTRFAINVCARRIEEIYTSIL